MRDMHAQTIASIVYRSLALAEARAPAKMRGAYIAVGAGFDALQAVGKVLATAKQHVLVVDPYMDGEVLFDSALTAAEGVTIRRRRPKRAAEIVILFADGTNKRQIAARLSISRASVRRMLSPVRVPVAVPVVVRYEYGSQNGSYAPALSAGIGQEFLHIAGEFLPGWLA
jgi:DNA-binding NarL/FixJ family response regulator